MNRFQLLVAFAAASITAISLAGTVLVSNQSIYKDIVKATPAVGFQTPPPPLPPKQVVPADSVKLQVNQVSSSDRIYSKVKVIVFDSTELARYPTLQAAINGFDDNVRSNKWYPYMLPYQVMLPPNEVRTLLASLPFTDTSALMGPSSHSLVAKLDARSYIVVLSA